MLPWCVNTVEAPKHIGKCGTKLVSETQDKWEKTVLPWNNPWQINTTVGWKKCRNKLPGVHYLGSPGCKYTLHQTWPVKWGENGEPEPRAGFLKAACGSREERTCALKQDHQTPQDTGNPRRCQQSTISPDSFLTSDGIPWLLSFCLFPYFNFSLIRVWFKWIE